MKKFLEKIPLYIAGFYFKWRQEIKVVLFTTVLWSIAPLLILLVPEFPGAYENLYLQKIIYGMCTLSYAATFIKFLMAYLWPELNHYLAFQYNDNFKTLTPWQKTLISHFTYSFFLLCIILAIF